MRFERLFKLGNQALQVREDRVCIFRLVMTVRQADLTVDRILRSRRDSRLCVLIIIAVLQFQERGVVGFGDLLNGIELATRSIDLIGEALVVHTEHDMGEGVAFVLVLTGGIRLINHQRRFGSEDTHIIDDEVITVIIRCHVIYANAEVRIFLILLNREIDLVPLVGRSQVSGQVRSDILP